MQLTVNYAKDSLKVGLSFLANQALVTFTAFANGKECPLANLNLTVEKATAIKLRLENEGHSPIPIPITPARPRRKRSKRPAP